MNPLRSLFPLATLIALFATLAAAQPVSRIVLGTYPQTGYLSDQPRIAADSEGNSYIAGTYFGVYLRPLHDGGEYPFFTPFFSKVAKSGQTVFSKILAGGTIEVIAVASSGDIYLAGASIGDPPIHDIDFQSAGNPPIQATDGALASSPARGFLARYRPDGTVVFIATLSAIPTAVAVDSSGAAYLTGVAGSEFHPTPSSFQSTMPNRTCAPWAPYTTAQSRGLCSNAFAAKLSADGSTLIYATFLGGSGTDAGEGIAVDAAGSVIIAGNTTSGDFPLTGPVRSSGAGKSDVFISKLNGNGSTLLLSTIIGGSGNDSAVALATDADGSLYVAGTTESLDFPVTPGAYQTSFNGGNSDAFLVKLDRSLTPLFVTYLGSSGDDTAGAMVLNTDNRLYIAVDSSITTPPVALTGPLFATLLDRPRADCDPRGVLLAVDKDTGSLLDFEGLVGFDRGAAVAADATGILHVFANSAINGDFVITDGNLQGSRYSPLLARIDFTKSDVFQPMCVVGIADHAIKYAPLVRMPDRPATYIVPAPLYAGEIIAIQGRGLGPAEPWQAQPGIDLPDEIANIEVTFDGLALPLLSVSDRQIRAVVPYSQAAPKIAPLVIRNGNWQFTESFAVNPYGVSIFMRDNSGLAAALNEDGSINSLDNPAPRGSVVSLFATGMGPLNPALPDNAWISTQPPWPSLSAGLSIYIQSPVPSGGAGMPILYAGPAPGEPPGKYQINAQIPDLASTGKALFRVYPDKALGYPDQNLWIAVK